MPSAERIFRGLKIEKCRVERVSCCKSALMSPSCHPDETSHIALLGNQPIHISPCVLVDLLPKACHERRTVTKHHHADWIAGVADLTSGGDRNGGFPQTGSGAFTLTSISPNHFRSERRVKHDHQLPCPPSPTLHHRGSKQQRGMPSTPASRIRRPARTPMSGGTRNASKAHSEWRLHDDDCRHDDGRRPPRSRQPPARLPSAPARRRRIVGLHGLRVAEHH